MTYLWRDIDAQWWNLVKVGAKAKDMNIREFLVFTVSSAIAPKADAVDPVDGTSTP